jgi:predicted small lipoprotein YifL
MRAPVLILAMVVSLTAIGCGGGEQPPAETPQASKPTTTGPGAEVKKSNAQASPYSAADLTK